MAVGGGSSRRSVRCRFEPGTRYALKPALNRAREAAAGCLTAAGYRQGDDARPRGPGRVSGPATTRGPCQRRANWIGGVISGSAEIKVARIVSVVNAVNGKQSR